MTAVSSKSCAPFYAALLIAAVVSAEEEDCAALVKRNADAVQRDVAAIVHECSQQVLHSAEEGREAARRQLIEECKEHGIEEAWCPGLPEQNAVPLALQISLQEGMGLHEMHRAAWRGGNFATAEGLAALFFKRVAEDGDLYCSHNPERQAGLYANVQAARNRWKDRAAQYRAKGCHETGASHYRHHNYS